MTNYPESGIKLGLDTDDYFKKDRFSRMLITGGSVADNAISAMRSYDMAKQREMEAEAKKRHK
jgi:hypothetical protein